MSTRQILIEELLTRVETVRHYRAHTDAIALETLTKKAEDTDRENRRKADQERFDNISREPCTSNRRIIK